MPLVLVVGTAPIDSALARITEALGYRCGVAASLDQADFAGASAVVLATHGHDEPEAIRAALDAGVKFIGLVASEKRGGALLDAMDLGEVERARVRTLVGIEIGPRHPRRLPCRSWAVWFKPFEPVTLKSSLQRRTPCCAKPSIRSVA